MKWPDLIGGPVIIGPLPSVSAAPSPPARQPCPAWLSRPLPLQASARRPPTRDRSEEHTSELQSLMRISYAVFCLKKKTKNKTHTKPQSQMTQTVRIKTQE